MKKLMSVVWFLFIFTGCFLTFGCATKMPISDSIIRDIGGVGNANQFQYFISKTITLTLVDSQSSVRVEGGQLRRESATARETVIIRANLPGLVRGHHNINTNSDLNPTLMVAFEELEGTFPTITFRKQREGSQERYYLTYQDVSNRIIRYGNNDYRVSFDNNKPHEGNPYLIIKGSQSAKNTSTSRRASGLKL